ncbi:hypothetical protein BsWGS_12022 [Bradybaena similaris]
MSESGGPAQYSSKSDVWEIGSSIWYILSQLWELIIFGGDPYPQVFPVTFFNVPTMTEVAFTLTLALTFGLVNYTLQSKRDFSSFEHLHLKMSFTIILASLSQQILPVPGASLAIIFLFGAYICVSIIWFTHELMSNLSPLEYKLCAILILLYIFILFFWMHFMLWVIKEIW